MTDCVHSCCKSRPMGSNDTAEDRRVKLVLKRSGEQWKSRKIFDGAKVAIYGSLGVITALEFLQHHFSEMGHRDLLPRNLDGGRFKLGQA